MFKVGDRVRTKVGTHQNNPGTYPPDGTECEVTKAGNSWGVIEISSMWTPGPPFAVWETDIEYIQDPLLPVGKSNKVLDDLQIAWDGLLDSQEPKICDCGGYKTYKSYEPSYHSHWCSSQQ